MRKTNRDKVSKSNSNILVSCFFIVLVILICWLFIASTKDNNIVTAPNNIVSEAVNYQIVVVNITDLTQQIKCENELEGLSWNYEFNHTLIDQRSQKVENIYRYRGAYDELVTIKGPYLTPSYNELLESQEFQEYIALFENEDIYCETDFFTRGDLVFTLYDEGYEETFECNPEYLQDNTIRIYYREPFDSRQIHYKINNNYIEYYEIGDFAASAMIDCIITTIEREKNG